MRTAAAAQSFQIPVQMTWASPWPKCSHPVEEVFKPKQSRLLTETETTPVPPYNYRHSSCKPGAQRAEEVEQAELEAKRRSMLKQGGDVPQQQDACSLVLAMEEVVLVRLAVAMFEDSCERENVRAILSACAMLQRDTR
eukprot:6208036-Pleurochrysis_carterae.AAC.3